VAAIKEKVAAIKEKWLQFREKLVQLRENLLNQVEMVGTRLLLSKSRCTETNQISMRLTEVAVRQNQAAVFKCCT
jgi:hypothetical protein